MRHVFAFAFFSATFLGPSQALEKVEVAATDPVSAARRIAAPRDVGDEGGMQAVCREVLVETDEGYGITDHVTRFICNEAR